MTYRDIEELQMLLDKDIRGVIAKGDISPQDYQCLDVAIDITKDLYDIARMIPMMEEGVNNERGYGGYSRDGGQGGGNSGLPYGYGGEYYPRMRGNSYDNGGGNRGGNNNGGGNGRGRNSGHMGMEEKLNMMMQNASNEQERQIISKLMKEMENM